MGSSSKKKDKDKESRKRRHRDGYVEESYEAHKEKRHKHKHKHHKKRSKHSKHNYQSDDSDVVEIIDSPPATPQTSSNDKSNQESSYQEKEPSPMELSPPRVEPPRPPPARAEPAPRQAPPRTEPPRPPRVEAPRQVPPQSHREASPELQRQHTESLSIEETNRLRAKLGLKPLDVGPSRSESSSGRRDEVVVIKDDKKKDDLGEFYHKPAENWKDKAQQEKIRDKIREQKEKRHLQNKLSKVKLLADGDSDDDAAASWVQKSRQIEQQRMEAQKRAKMLEELDEQFGIGEVIESEERNRRSQQYTDRNLRGLRVDHDVGSFKDERTTILTLKDKGVLDEDEDDVLINVNMVDDERYKKNVENKKKKILYNAYEDDEFDELGNPKEKSLLSQYDEEIEGAKRDGFVIGQEHSFDRRQLAAQSVKDKLAKKKIETLVTKDLQIASDYYNEDEMAKFKKPKKKVRKIRTKGKLTADALEEINNKGIESVGSRRPKYKNDPGVFDIDDVPAVNIPTDIKLEDDKDDMLERALHKARKLKQKENVVAELLGSTEVKTEPLETFDSGSNIILNSTAEFCRTLGDIPTYGKSGNREDNEEVMDFDADEVKEETTYDDEVIMVDVETSGWNSVDPNAVARGETAPLDPQEIQILDEEPDVSAGVGAALRLAMSKGYLDREQKNRPSNSRLAHLQAQHYSIEDKTYDGDGERQGRRDRWYAGPITEFRERGDFKPNVKLEYIDDDGHILNSKEAFRYLSHKFHGKGPGKNKIEKRIKKNLQEQLMKKMSSTDTPLGTLNMLQAKQKETQSPFVVLSGSKQSQATVIAKTNRH